MHVRPLFLGTILLSALSIALPAPSSAQQNRGPGSPDSGNKSRPAPSNGGSKPSGSRPGGGSPGNNRPAPQRPSSGGGGRPPARPNPGGNRPNSGGNRPHPGGGNNRPPSRPNPGRPGGRPPQWGRPPQNRPSYNFRPADRGYLLRYYQRNLGYINRANRPRFVVGGYFPFGDIGYISPLPPSLYGSIPPPPPGYSVGYYDGYVVVYDPATYFIASLVDLLQ